MGIKDFFNNTLSSLNTKDEGFSFRKVLALTVLGMTIFLHVKFACKENVISFLAYDFGFISVLLGLLNLDRFVYLKFGQTPPTEPTPPTVTTTVTTPDVSTTVTTTPTVAGATASQQ